MLIYSLIKVQFFSNGKYNNICINKIYNYIYILQENILIHKFYYNVMFHYRRKWIIITTAL